MFSPGDIVAARLMDGTPTHYRARVVRPGPLTEVFAPLEDTPSEMASTVYVVYLDGPRAGSENQVVLDQIEPVG